MIVYVASYPRSGNALVRSLIQLNWAYLTTSDAMIDLDVVARFNPRYDISPHKSNPTLASFKRDDQSAIRNMLAPAVPLPTPMRRSLAKSPEIFFVKTHEWPRLPSFEGEKVIQIVRHPGDAILSEQQLKKDIRDKHAELTSIILGNEGYGCWSAYHGAWSAVSIPKLTLKFEEVAEDNETAVRQMAEFLGLPVPEQITHSPFEAAHAKNPTRNPVKRLDAWRKMEPDLRELLKRQHAETGRLFGYEF
tara:strand:+ start:161036 stop:161779 length:744 start_codon:yes stop_codon:yes gene_type:complete